MTVRRLDIAGVFVFTRVLQRFAWRILAVVREQSAISVELLDPKMGQARAPEVILRERVEVKKRVRVRRVIREVPVRPL